MHVDNFPLVMAEGIVADSGSELNFSDHNMLYMVLRLPPSPTHPDSDSHNTCLPPVHRPRFYLQELIRNSHSAASRAATPPGPHDPPQETYHRHLQHRLQQWSQKWEHFTATPPPDSDDPQLWAQSQVDTATKELTDLVTEALTLAVGIKPPPSPPLPSAPLQHIPCTPQLLEALAHLAHTRRTLAQARALGLNTRFLLYSHHKLACKSVSNLRRSIAANISLH